jgi:NADPH-dependent 2,4-dienoyl-CoA reductase/sulfur reductase-like enzyme
MNTKPSFVIVGGGMAGAIAAQTLREEGFDGKITLLGQEPNAPYERPPLSKDYLQSKADRHSIFVQPEHLRTSDPDVFAAGDIAHAYNPRLGRHSRVEHWANARRQGAVAAKAMLGHDAVDVRPSYFFTDQYDLSMEYTGDIGPAGYDRVIFRRYEDPRQVIVFWLYEQRVQAGMNINIWDVAEDIERLILSARPIDADDLADPMIPLTRLL